MERLPRPAPASCLGPSPTRPDGGRRGEAVGRDGLDGRGWVPLTRPPFITGLYGRPRRCTATGRLPAGEASRASRAARSADGASVQSVSSGPGGGSRGLGAPLGSAGPRRTRSRPALPSCGREPVHNPLHPPLSVLTCEPTPGHLRRPARRRRDLAPPPIRELPPHTRSAVPFPIYPRTARRPPLTRSGWRSCLFQ